MSIAKRLLVIMIISLMLSTAFAEQSQTMPPSDTKLWLQEALAYGFDMKTEDYSKYISTDYIEHIDGKVFNFQQWVHHMKGLKEIMKSYKLTYDEIIAEGNKIAASYVVHATKKDGNKVDIRIIAIFKLKNNKMIYCDELTHILSGKAGKELPSQE